MPLVPGVSIAISYSQGASEATGAVLEQSFPRGRRRAALIKSVNCRFRSGPSIWLAEYPSRLSDVITSLRLMNLPDRARSNARSMVVIP